MVRVIPTETARTDLVEIRKFSIEQFGSDAADKYFLGFDDAFDLLAEHPKAGPGTPQYGNAYRCLMHQRHRIFYVVQDETVLIVRVLHHALDAKQAFRKAAK